MSETTLAPVAVARAARKRIVIGIGEFAVSNDPAKVGGMVHLLLPDSKINPERAGVQPGAFADTGIPLLFRTAYAQGAVKARCRVHLVGGATISGAPTMEPSVGKRNVLAARQMLWRNGVMVEKEHVGGTAARNVALDLTDGSVQLSGSQVAAAVL